VRHDERVVGDDWWIDSDDMGWLVEPGDEDIQLVIWIFPSQM